MATQKKEEATKSEVVAPKSTVAVSEPAKKIEHEFLETTLTDVSKDQKEEVKTVISSEEDFLLKILEIQHEGGFGRHLDYMINERLKKIRK